MKHNNQTWGHEPATFHGKKETTWICLDKGHNHKTRTMLTYY